MTKNLFLLFVLYFFVVQAIILGLLTGNTLFYQLGAINTGAILLISILYAVCTAPDKPKEKNLAPLTKGEKKTEEKPDKSPKKSEEPESLTKSATLRSEGSTIAEKSTHSVQVVQPVPTTPKRRKKSGRSGQWRVFVLTLLIAATINFTVGELLTSRSPLLALVVGYLLYLIIGKVADLNGFFNLKKLFTARIYYLLLILALAYGLFYFYGKGDLIERYLPTLRGQENLFSGGKAETEIPPSINDNTSLFSTGDYIYEGTGEVISNPPEITTGAQQGSGTTVETEGNTGSTIPTPNETTPTAEENTPHTGTVVTAKNITMLEALKHVITTNQLPLSSKTDINFTSISKNNADYPYFKTAYETRMIGKNTDPSKQISCDTYIVIKGIGEGRNVGNYTDVKAAYWKKAEELGKLNGCQKGAWVTTTTL